MSDAGKRNVRPCHKKPLCGGILKRLQALACRLLGVKVIFDGHLRARKLNFGHMHGISPCRPKSLGCSPVFGKSRGFLLSVNVFWLSLRRVAFGIYTAVFPSHPGEK